MYHPGVPVTEMIAAVTGVNVWNTGYIPSTFMNSSDMMNFKERFLNLFYKMFGAVFTNWYQYGRNEILTKNLGSGHEDTNIIEKNASFIFINSNFEYDYSIPVSPEVIMTGCMHCQPPKSLPKVSTCTK